MLFLLSTLHSAFAFWVFTTSFPRAHRMPLIARGRLPGSRVRATIVRVRDGKCACGKWDCLPGSSARPGGIINAGVARLDRGKLSAFIVCIVLLYSLLYFSGPCAQLYLLLSSIIIYFKFLFSSTILSCRQPSSRMKWRLKPRVPFRSRSNSPGEGVEYECGY
jgi:hypothetical protein